MAVKVVFLFDLEISGAQELPVEIVHPFVDVVRHIVLLASCFLSFSLASKKVGLLSEVDSPFVAHPVDGRFIPELCRFAHSGHKSHPRVRSQLEAPIAWC